MGPSHRIEPIEPTYTPTTRRVSKARKGKRVHVCDKCEKVFTRAEHLRRHQLNHYAHAVHRCDFAGCSRTFQRPDLLARHMERHGSRVSGAVRKPADERKSRSSPPSPPSPIQVASNPAMMPARYAPATATVHDHQMLLAGQDAQNVQIWGPGPGAAAYLAHPLSTATASCNPVHPLTSPPRATAGNATLPPEPLRQPPQRCSSSHSSSTPAYAMIGAVTTMPDYAMPAVTAGPTSTSSSVSPLYKLIPTMSLSGHCLPSVSAGHWAGVTEPASSWSVAELVHPPHATADARSHALLAEHHVGLPVSSASSSASRLILSAGCSYQSPVSVAHDRPLW